MLVLVPGDGTGRTDGDCGHPINKEWDKWSKDQLCPEFSYANAFRLRVQPFKLCCFVDNNGLVNIQLQCTDTNRTVLG